MSAVSPVCLLVVSSAFRLLVLDNYGRYKHIGIGCALLPHVKFYPVSYELSKETYLLPLGQSGLEVEAINRLSSVLELKALISTNGLKALSGELLTIDNVVALNSIDKLRVLLTSNGIALLRESLLTFDDIIQIKDIQALDELATDSGLCALREGLLSVTQINSLPNISQLRILLTDNGLKALRIEPGIIQQISDGTIFCVKDLVEPVNLLAEDSVSYRVTK